MSLTLGHFAREKADTLGCMGSVIDALRGSDSVDMFLVKRRWQIAPYVHRYPSPVGRLGHTPCQAPDIFNFRSECYVKRRGFAQFDCACARCWNPRAIHGVSFSQAHTCEGADTWECTYGHQRASSPFAGFSGLRPVATRWANRRFWAALPGPAPLLSSTLTRSPARPLARLQMSPIARRTRNAADAATTQTYSRILTARAMRRSGLFYATATDISVGQEKTDGKGQTCSRRS